MKAILTGALLAGVLSGIWTGAALHGMSSAAQETVTIGVDAEPTGNTATSLGTFDSCVSVSTDDTFQVDLFVTDVVDLLAWEAYFVYDIEVINVVERDVLLFQEANSGSQVFDASETLPDVDARYRVAAADIAQPPAPDSGSGVLARLTLKAVGAGLSPASLSPIDVNGDGTIDLGPFLNGQRGIPISDADEDGYFDGPIFNAQIAVDEACPSGTPVATPTTAPVSPSPSLTGTPAAETPITSPSPQTSTAATRTSTPTPQPASPTAADANPRDDGDSAWTGGPAIIGYVLGGLAVMLLAGIGFLSIRRSRAR